MATTINPLQTGTNVRPVDIGKAGSLAAKSITDLAKSLTAIPQSNVNRAEQAFLNNLRGAKETGDFSGVNTDELIRAGADANQQAQAESTLRAGVLNQDRKNLQTEFDSRLAQNFDIAKNAYAEQPENIKNALTIDEGGNILQAVPNPTLSQSQIDQASSLFAKELENRGFKAVDSDRDFRKKIRNISKKRNASPEQQSALEEGFFAYKKGLETLEGEEANIVAKDEAQFNNALTNQTELLNIQKQQDTNRLGYTSQEANDVLKMKKNDLYDIVEGKFPAEISNWNIFRTWTGKKSGIDFKQLITETLNKGYKPYEIFEAIKATADTDPDWENIDREDFLEFLENQDRSAVKENLDLAASIDNLYQLKENELIANNTAEKLRALARRKGEFGIRDTANNRRFIDEYLPRAEQAIKAAQFNANVGDVDPSTFLSDNQSNTNQTSSNTNVDTSSSTISNPLPRVADPFNQPDLPPAVDGSGDIVSNRGTIDRATNNARVFPLDRQEIIDAEPIVDAPNTGTIDRRPIAPQVLDAVKLYQQTNGSDAIALERMLNDPRFNGDPEILRRLRQAWAYLKANP